MRFVLHRRNGNVALGALKQNVLFGAKAGSATPTDLQKLLAAGPEAMQKAYDSLLHGEEIDPSEIEYLPPLPSPEKIICLGLNYKDHAAESGFEPPKYPVLFGRFSSSLIGHAAPIVRPRVSHQLVFEGELVAVVGKPGRDIPVERALEHVAGYSIFNDASVRDFSSSPRNGQSAKTSTQPELSGLRLSAPMNWNLEPEACG